mgnify:CR=1 FL=1
MLKESQLHNYQRQSVERKKLEALGFPVTIIDTTEKLNNFIKEIGWT